MRVIKNREEENKKGITESRLRTIRKGDSFMVEVSTPMDDYTLYVDCSEGEVTEVASPSIDPDEWTMHVGTDPVLETAVKRWNDIAYQIYFGRYVLHV